MKKSIIRYATAAAALAFTGMAFAASSQSIGTIAEPLAGEEFFGSFANLISGIAYLAGAFFGIRSAILLKDHTDNPGQIRLSRPLMALFVSALFIAFPSTLDVLATTFLQVSSGEKVNMLDDIGTSTVAAGGCTDLSCMATAFGNSIPGLKKLVAVGAMLAGGFFILRAIFLLPQVEQGRAELSKVIWTFIPGIILWSLLPAIQIALSTIGTDTTALEGGSGILSYMTDTGSKFAKFNASINAVLMFIQLLGLIAFVRGAMILKAIGEHKDGSVGRAMTHIFGGSAAMNITWAVKVLAVTVGAGWICNPTTPTGKDNPLAVFCGKPT